MKHFVSINKTEIEFFSDENFTILEQAELNGHSLKNGCRLGACRVCKLKLLSGDIEYIVGNKIGLTKKELDENYFLPCCAVAKSNIACELDGDNKTLSETKEGAVICDIKRIPGVTILKFKLSKRSKMNFIPGQYIGIEVPNREYRYYSIANIPKNDGYVEIHVAKNKNGVFSDLICEKLEVNDVLWIYGPYGDFISGYHDEVRDIVFVATGTGFAPIKSIIESGLFNERKIYLLWGGRRRVEHYFSEIIDNWKNTLHNFNFHMALSRQNEEEHLESHCGYVQDVFRKEIDLNDDIEVYMCGSPNMINDMSELLKNDYQLHEDYIHVDVFYPNS
ncbi:CDP-6-deoxy-delta-3,4-glucoseen reductase [Xenorhabdus vietnamensis]|uniref:NAD(P)H-flavin reductase n=1 Tax=Xenorhabdus vietnamensis TaxID=351656 RepID=A0A1Y2SDV7_9GAMM|nr:FAD-binding oxidoreductase [Xenorhabdus vietnamensis]OTA16939.1 CDP-6-deoxy-delta-3,4-glucoseen reductase [Xenorhabdus vietnamensis]